MRNTIKMKHDLREFSSRLGNNYWIEENYDDNGGCIGWELYNMNYREVTENAIPIMTSETHSFKELKHYVRKHRIYDTLDYHNIILCLLLSSVWINLFVRMIWENLNTDFGQGMYYGLITGYLIIMLTSIFTFHKNNKSHKLYIHEKYDNMFEQWEKEYQHMGKNK